jgi:hypothetical protein
VGPGARNTGSDLEADRERCAEALRRLSDAQHELFAAVAVDAVAAVPRPLQTFSGVRFSRMDAVCQRVVEVQL